MLDLTLISGPAHLTLFFGSAFENASATLENLSFHRFINSLPERLLDNFFSYSRAEIPLLTAL